METVDPIGDEERPVAPPPLPEPEPPTLRAGRASAIFIIYIVTQLAVGIALGLVLAFVVGVKHGVTDPGSVEGAIDHALMLLVVPLSIVGVMVGALLAFLLTRWSLRGSIREGALAQLGWQASSKISIYKSLTLGCAFAVIYLYLVTFLFPPDEDQTFGPLAAAAAAGGWQRLLWAFLALVLAPPIEEFMFRGVLFSGLAKSVKVRPAAVIVTLIFILLHMTELRSYWPAWLAITTLGCATLYVRIKSDSLGPALAMHFGYNVLLVISVFFLPAMPVQY